MGENIEEEFYGFDARIILHEIDHLHGILPTNLSVSKGNIRYKYNLIEVNKVNDSYKEKFRTEYSKLENLYKADKNFQKKADSKEDKLTFFFQLILGKEKFEEYEKEIQKAIKIDVSRGKNKKV